MIIKVKVKIKAKDGCGFGGEKLCPDSSGISK